MPQTDISSYIIHLSYLGVFLWFVIIEQLTPIPEEVSLMSIGYIAIHNDLDPFLCGVAALTGLLICDNLLFYISFTGNKLAQKLLHKVSPRLMDRIKKNLETNSFKALFLSALLPKLRFFSPLIAAAMNVSWKKFFFVNAAATLFYVLVYMSIGIFFHTQLDAVLAEMKLIQHSIFVVLMITVAVFVAFKAQKIIFKG
jgi:membrane protein DedA with SNARE-associated domain